MKRRHFWFAAIAALLWCLAACGPAGVDAPASSPPTATAAPTAEPTAEPTAVPTMTPTPQTYRLSISADPGLQLPVDFLKTLSERYPAGALVPLAAEMDSGYVFAGWEAVGGGSFDDALRPDAVFTMPAAGVQLFARAAPAGPVVTLSVGVASAGTGEAGTVCLSYGDAVQGPGDRLSYTAAVGQSVRLSATPAPGYVFSHWEAGDDAALPEDRFASVIQMTVPDRDAVWTAYFRPADGPTYTQRLMESGAVGDADPLKARWESPEWTQQPRYAVVYEAAVDPALTQALKDSQTGADFALRAGWTADYIRENLCVVVRHEARYFCPNPQWGQAQGEFITQQRLCRDPETGLWYQWDQSEIEIDAYVQGKAPWPDALVIREARYVAAAEPEDWLPVSVAAEVDAPAPVVDAARRFVAEKLDRYARGGEVKYMVCGLHTEAGGADAYRVTQARITALTPLSTGAAGQTEGVALYRLEYRLTPDRPEAVADQTRLEDGRMTEWENGGQPCLVLRWSEAEGETRWTLVCMTDTAAIQRDYGTPELLERYGSAETAAAMLLGGLTDGQVLTPAAAMALYQQGQTTLGWFRLRSLDSNFGDSVTVDGSVYYRVTDPRFPTLAALQTAAEAVFTRAFAAALFTADRPNYVEVDGQLYTADGQAGSDPQLADTRWKAMTANGDGSLTLTVETDILDESLSQVSGSQTDSFRLNWEDGGWRLADLHPIYCHQAETPDWVLAYEAFYEETLRGLTDNADWNAGPVTGLELADLSGDGTPELVVYLPGASVSAAAGVVTWEAGELRAFQGECRFGLPLAKNAVDSCFFANPSTATAGDRQTAGFRYYLDPAQPPAAGFYVLNAHNAAWPAQSFTDWYRFGADETGALRCEPLVSLMVFGEEPDGQPYRETGWQVNGEDVTREAYAEAEAGLNAWLGTLRAAEDGGEARCLVFHAGEDRETERVASFLRQWQPEQTWARSAYTAADFVGRSAADITRILGEDYAFLPGGYGGGQLFHYAAGPDMYFDYAPVDWRDQRLRGTEQVQTVWLGEQGRVNDFLRGRMRVQELEAAVQGRTEVLSAGGAGYDDELDGKIYLYTVETAELVVRYQWFGDTQRGEGPADYTIVSRK